MTELIDLTGQRFGRLLVVEYAGRSKWLCRCDCGNEKTVDKKNLKSGKTKSCGCGQYVDLSNQRFGKLTVIEFSGRNNQGGSRWLCLCDCGNQKIVNGGNLKSGTSKSCGCSESVDPTMKKNSLLKQRFGKLIVVGFAGKDEHGAVLWLCKCDCGENINVKTSSLKHGLTISCGCHWKDSTAGAFNKLYSQYKKGAKTRNLPFELSEEEFKSLTTGNCFYCGIEPTKESKSGKKTGTYMYNGIDRVDSLKGYTLENSVSCCTVCNLAKRVSSQDDFRSWIKRVHSNLFEEKR